MLDYRRYLIRDGEVFDADSGTRVGYAERHGRGFEAREPPDGSLVFSVRRARTLFGRRFVIRDSQGVIAGRVGRRRLTDPRGFSVATIDVADDGIHFLGTRDGRLGSVTPAEDGDLLCLAEEIARRPPAIMLLLAAVLCRHEP